MAAAYVKLSRKSRKRKVAENVTLHIPDLGLEVRSRKISSWYACDKLIIDIIDIGLLMINLASIL